MKNYAFRLVFHIIFLCVACIAAFWAWQTGRLGLMVLCLVALVAAAVSLYTMQVRVLTTLRDFIHRMRYTEQRERPCMPYENRLMREIKEELDDTLQFFRRQLQDETTRQQYYERLLDEADEAFVVCRVDGSALWMNRAARVHPAIANVVPAEWLRPGRQARLVRLHHEGEEYEMALSCILFRTGEQAVYLVSLKNVRELLEQTQLQAWQKLIRILTHEIMNSMTPILSLSETLSERFVPETPGKHDYDLMLQAMQTIHRRSKGILSFTESYRKLARVPAPQCEEMDVSELMTDLSRLFVGTDLQFSSPYTGLTIYADRGQIEQVFINLVKNACEASEPDAPHIRITLDLLPDGTRRFRIADKGKGILPEALDRIFLPFYTTKESGSGIGLALCKQIVVRHNGRLTVESTPVRGTTFTLCIPPRDLGILPV